MSDVTTDPVRALGKAIKRANEISRQVHHRAEAGWVSWRLRHPRGAVLFKQLPWQFTSARGAVGFTGSTPEIRERKYKQHVARRRAIAAERLRSSTDVGYVIVDLPTDQPANPNT